MMVLGCMCGPLERKLLHAGKTESKKRQSTVLGLMAESTTVNAIRKEISMDVERYADTCLFLLFSFQFILSCASPKFTWSNGTSYVGAFHQNMRQGQGRLVGSGGEIIYDGRWESSQPLDCSIENILDQLVETEHGGSENDVYVDDFFTCKTNALESSENTFPQATTADSKNFGELLQVIEKPSKQKVSCGSTASDGFHPRDMGLVDMTNKLALSPEKSRSKSFQHGC